MVEQGDSEYYENILGTPISAFEGFMGYIDIPANRGEFWAKMNVIKEREAIAPLAEKKIRNELIEFEKRGGENVNELADLLSSRVTRHQNNNSISHDITGLNSPEFKPTEKKFGKKRKERSSVGPTMGVSLMKESTKKSKKEQIAIEDHNEDPSPTKKENENNITSNANLEDPQQNLEVVENDPKINPLENVEENIFEENNEP